MDQNKIDLIEKFLRNEISSEEIRILRQWYNSKDFNENYLSSYYEDQWQSASVKYADSATESRLRVWKRLQVKMSKESIPEKKRLSIWFQVAGIVAIVLIGVFLGLGLKQKNISQEDLIVQVENGQKARLQLPDGSTVWLNSASQISYSSKFGKKNRIVKLVGEAYFEVESNPENPFIVKTWNGLDVVAIGTKFNVKSYKDDNFITGTLLEGSIKVGNSSFSEMLLLNERIIFDNTNNTFRKTKIQSSEDAIFWLTNQFVFDNETLENIAKILERMYNVKFSFSLPELKNIQYSGKINNNSMENVLDLITTVSPIHYAITDSVITFIKK